MAPKSKVIAKRSADLSLRGLSRGWVEILGIAGFTAYKVKAGSPPQLKEILSLLAVFLVVRLCRWLSKQDFMRVVWTWGRYVDATFSGFVRRYLFPMCEPHEFLHWLSSGRLDANVKCVERYPLMGDTEADRPCQRRACRFTHERRYMPSIVRKNLRFATRFMGNVHLSDYKRTITTGKIPPPAQLIGWTVHGIAMRVSEKRWKGLVATYGSDPVHMVAYVDCGLRRLGIRTELRRVRMEADGVVLFGEYASGHRFLPKYLVEKRSAGRMVSIPICEGWRQDRGLHSIRPYTPAAAIES